MKQPTPDKPTPTPSLKGRGEGGADNQTSGSPTGANDSASDGRDDAPRCPYRSNCQAEAVLHALPTNMKFAGTPRRPQRPAPRDLLAEEPYKYYDSFVERGDVEASPEM